MKTHHGDAGDKLLNPSSAPDLQSLSPADMKPPELMTPRTSNIVLLKGNLTGKSFKKAARTVMVVGTATTRRRGSLARKWSSVHPSRPVRFEGYTTDSRLRTPHTKWGLDWYVGTLAGQLASFMLLLLVITVASGVVWRNMHDEATDDDGDDYEGKSDWAAVVWFVWNLLFDSGTAFEGLSSSASHKVFIVASVISVVGFVFNLTLLGFVVDRIREVLDEAKEIYGRDVCNDHILICGWTDKTLFLLQVRALGVHLGGLPGGSFCIALVPPFC
jgi:hypothetical protein